MEVLFRVRRDRRNIDRFLKVALVLRGIVYWGRFGISSGHIFVEKLGLPISGETGFSRIYGKLTCHIFLDFICFLWSHHLISRGIGLDARLYIILSLDGRAALSARCHDALSSVLLAPGRDSRSPGLSPSAA